LGGEFANCGVANLIAAMSQLPCIFWSGNANAG
jgi:hypothetical protein